MTRNGGLRRALAPTHARCLIRVEIRQHGFRAIYGERASGRARAPRNRAVNADGRAHELFLPSNRPSRSRFEGEPSESSRNISASSVCADWQTFERRRTGARRRRRSAHGEARIISFVRTFPLDCQSHLRCQESWRLQVFANESAFLRRDDRPAVRRARRYRRANRSSFIAGTAHSPACGALVGNLRVHS